MHYSDMINEFLGSPDPHHYLPLLFSASLKEDKRDLEKLVKEPGKVVEVHDTLVSQIREWVKAKHPEVKLSKEDYEKGMQNYLAGRPLEELGTWVYYPWSRKLVRLLVEADFAFLRTAANRHKITEEEQSKLHSKKIGVVGMSVGQSVAMVLAQERGFGEIRLADYDTLELNNMNRIRSRVSDIGYPKVISIAREIAELDPYLKVTLFKEGLRQENMDAFFLDGGKLDLVIDECDSVDIKIMVRIWAKRLSVPVLMEASDRGTLDVERFDLEPDREIMHGWLSGLDLDLGFLKTLQTAEEKLPYILPISGLETLSPRMKASMLEIESSLTTWPQLASAVQMGGALTADTCRRIFLDQFRESGRYHIDLEELIAPRQSASEHQAETLPSSVPPGESDHEWVSECLSQVTIEAGEIQDKQTWLPLIEAALRAPSIGNMQPWKWVVKEGRFYLFHDRERSLGDFKYMGAMVSLGAAMENFLLAAHQASIGVEYQLFPLGTSSPLVACGRWVNQPTSTDLFEPDQLAPWIFERETNRQLGKRLPIGSESLDLMKAALESIPSVRLHFCTEEKDLQLMEEVIAEAERWRLLDPEGHRSFFEEELRWDSEHARKTGDGVDLDTLDLSPSEKAGIRLMKDPQVASLLRKWGKGRALGDIGRSAIRSASAIGLVTLSELGTEALFQGGRAIERSWLTATKESLSLQPMLAAVYPLSRIRHGGAEGMDAAVVRAFHDINDSLENVFEEVKEREPIFLFRLALAPRPKIKSFRRDIDSTLQTEAVL